MSRALGRVGIEFERISAVDGASLDADTMAEFQTHHPIPPNDECWLPGQVGCFLSHLTVWEQIAAAQDAWAAVFEDDIQIAADARVLLASSNWIPPAADIIRLEASRPMRLRGGRPIGVAPSRKVYRALSGTSGSAGYIIAKRTAARLIATPPELQATVDVLLFRPRDSPVARELRRYQVAPAVCIQEGVLHGTDAYRESLISLRPARGAAYRRQVNPLLSLWPIQRRAVRFEP